MKSWSSPLWVFVVGNMFLLVAIIFMPGIDTASANLAAATAGGMTTTFWGWSWLMGNGVIRFLVYLIFEGIILFATAMAFLKSKH